ncbi:hypothetical protein FHETE_9123 [Fusarium heterosporum]|uniref:Uncharacterized protein n=1 Tax=Fusarium heterosporum TaxID=42747 RepID=A0A8H5T049_FUSHE|nr:hypothetical protein FHETE_9123 [Fusarium heterosporum]
MRPSTVVLGLITSAAAANVKVIWHHDKADQKPMLSVYDESDKLIAQSCSSLIQGSPHTIDFSDVDDNGFGNFTVGDTKFKAHSKPDISGGPVCTKKYDARVAVVECTGIDFTPGADAPMDDAEDCHDHDVKLRMRFFTSRNRVRAVEAIENRPLLKSRHLNERAPQDCSFLTQTSVIDDGNPHQNYYDKQLSENINCGNAAGCTVGEMNSKSFTVSWSLGASGINAYEWISAGFAVEEQWTTGSNYECNGDPGDTVCIWYNTAHTACRWHSPYHLCPSGASLEYANNVGLIDTVHNVSHDTCDIHSGWVPDSDPFVMKSPNSSNRGGGYYCVVGSCRAQGDAYWDESGRPGGP